MCDVGYIRSYGHGFGYCNIKGSWDFGNGFSAPSCSAITGEQTFASECFCSDCFSVFGKFIRKTLIKKLFFNIFLLQKDVQNFVWDLGVLQLMEIKLSCIVTQDPQRRKDHIYGGPMKPIVMQKDTGSMVEMGSQLIKKLFVWVWIYLDYIYLSKPSYCKLISLFVLCTNFMYSNIWKPWFVSFADCFCFARKNSIYIEIVQWSLEVTLTSLTSQMSFFLMFLEIRTCSYCKLILIFINLISFYFTQISITLNFWEKMLYFPLQINFTSHVYLFLVVSVLSDTKKMSPLKIYLLCFPKGKHFTFFNHFKQYFCSKMPIHARPAKW